MPKVPEGKFNKEISSRIGSPRIPDIASPSRQIKRLGAGFQKIGDTLAAAQKKADSLQEINKSEKSFEADIQPQIDQIFKDAIDGKIKDSDGNSMDMSEAVKKSLDEYSASALSKPSSDSGAFAEHFERFMVPKMERLHQKAEKHQAKQKIAGVNSSMEESSNLIVQRQIDGVSSPEDIASYMSQAEQSSTVVGADQAANYISALKLKIASAQRQVISKQGATPENVEGAKAAFAAIPESQRRVLTRGFDEFVNDKINSEKMFAYQLNKKHAEKKMWPREMALESTKTAKVMSGMENDILAEGETGEMRQNPYAKLAGSQMASQIFMNGYGRDVNSEDTQKAMSEMMLTTMERLDGKHISTLGKDERKDGRTPTGKIDKFADKIEKEFRSEIARLNKIRQDDPQEWINQYNPALAEDLYSGDPSRGAKAEAELAKFYAGANIPQGKRRIISNRHATTFAETFKTFESGGDPTGKQGDDLITQLVSSVPEDMADRAVNDMIEMEGVPPEFLYVSKSGDRAFRRFLSGASSKYDANLASLITDGRLQEDINGNSRGAFKKKVAALIQRQIPEISKLYTAGAGMHEGYVNSVMMLAAEQAAGNKMNLHDATMWATKRMKETFNVAAQGTSSVLMDKAYATKHNIPMDAVEKVVKSSNTLDGIVSLRRAGYKIDFEKMAVLLKNNPRLAPQMNNFVKQLNSKKGLKNTEENFHDLFGKNIVARPDKNQHNRVRYYLQDPQIGSNIFPLILDTAQEYAGPETSEQHQSRLHDMEPISVPIHEYYNQKVSDEEAKKFRRGGSTPVGTFRQTGGN
jgi:hypothetical protein